MADKDSDPVVEIWPGASEGDSRPPTLDELNPLAMSADVSPCKHLRVTLDADARTCVCRDCGAAIDPFDYLVSASGRWHDRRKAADLQVRRTLARLRSDCRTERSKLEALTRAKRNLQAQVRRLKKKLERKPPPALSVERGGG